MTEAKKRGRKANSIKTIKMSDINNLLSYIDIVPEKEDPDLPLSLAKTKLKDGFIKLLDKGYDYTQVANFISSSIGIKISEKEIKEIVGPYQRKEKQYPVELLDSKFSFIKHLKNTPRPDDSNGVEPISEVQPDTSSNNGNETAVQDSSTEQTGFIKGKKEGSKESKTEIGITDKDDKEGEKELSSLSFAERNAKKNRSGAGYISVKKDTEDI